MRVLAIDPALRKTGFAIVEEFSPRQYRAVTYGVIQNPAKRTHSRCLLAIREALADLVVNHQPDCAAIESTIYVQSYQTAIVLGAVRGACLVAAAEAGLSIYEYAPKRVKQAVVGRGGADKQQVAFMMRALLGLTETPLADAADALAIGMAHLYTKDPIRGVTEPASEI